MTLNVVHTSLSLRYQLPQLVGKKSCLLSPCSVGCSHNCETVKLCPGGVLSCYGNDFRNVTFCWQGQVVPVRVCLTAVGLPDGLTPITDESKFIDFDLSHPPADLLNSETVTILFFFSPTLQVIPDLFCLFPFLKNHLL